MATEKEKIPAQLPYYALDEELSQERLAAQKACFRINSISPELAEECNEILKELLGSTKENFYIEPPFHCDYGHNISLGDNFYSNYNPIILDCAEVSIGDNVMLVPNVSIFTAGHPVHAKKRNEGLEYSIPVTIGNNIWIGGNTVINPGINIRDNTVIGSGSVLTRDIPSNVIAAGNPCKVIKEITGNDKNYYFKKRRF
ncbi:sugar O-acetyltransferase [Christiangramia echinicola]|uniref:sugar O-acetyltransferase n=1 Tax=Christiangramia echinicola TaxID=279359 RepID=UPI0004050860|nr:sugar O-acetyltransferase [Christiangramia echinicola]